VLLRYLRGSDEADFDPPFEALSENAPMTALELGAGTGIVGLTLAELLVGSGRTGDRVVLTDLPQVCVLLQENLHLHRPQLRTETVSVEPLAWGDARHAQLITQKLNGRRLSHIICSDLVYFPELLGPLLRTLLHLTTTPDPPLVVMSYKIRSLPKETPFWSAFGLWFAYTPALECSKSGTEWKRFGSDADSFVFCATRRPESQAWVMPEDNAALLGGEGARGTAKRKGDDTFEIMLFMGLDSD